MKSMGHCTIPNLMRALACSAVLFAAPAAGAQTKNQSSYVSPADRELSIGTVSLTPVTDNVSGIYARPLNEFLAQRFENDPQWSLVPADGDATLGGRVVKGPAGLSLTMTLGTGKDARPLLIEESGNLERTDLPYLKDVAARMLSQMRAKMPYRGTLVSRRGDEVTMNIGKNSGLADGAMVSVIQILKINRHPKKQFMIGAEREIMGKVRVTKADDELSFGTITFEKETGLLTAGMKVLPDEMVASPAGPKAPENASFGDKPVEWLPEPAPQYGRVQILAGLGQYQTSASFATAGGISGTNSLTPNLGLSVEGWIDADWFVGFDLRQSAFSIGNDYPGASPSRLNVSLSKYSVDAGRNFLLGTDFFGPKIQLSAGFGKFSSRIDESNPAVFGNMEYGGLHFGLLFNTPIDPETPWDLGAKLKYHWSPGLTESISSGSTKSVSAVDFGFLIARRVRQNFRYVGELTLENYNSSFSDTGDRAADPVSSISHRMTTLLVGLEYAF